MKYRKRPVTIEAFRFNIDPRPDWFQDRVSDNSIITFQDHCVIRTLEGEMRGEVGDWIIRGVKGEIYPCKPDIFAMTYEEVRESTQGGHQANPLAPDIIEACAHAYVAHQCPECRCIAVKAQTQASLDTMLAEARGV